MLLIYVLSPAVSIFRVFLFHRCLSRWEKKAWVVYFSNCIRDFTTLPIISFPSVVYVFSFSAIIKEKNYFTNIVR